VVELGGGVVLTEPYAVVAQDTDDIRRNTVLPLLVGMLGAALAGGLLARRIARPLASAAEVAHRLADGERGVRARADGPREAAEISRALGVLDEALVRSENRQREFLLSVSHELRTPLTALQGWAEALADGLVEPEQLPEVGRVLAGETGRLERFLGDLLDLARLEADDFRLHVTATDLAALGGEAAAFWSGSRSGPRSASQPGEAAELRWEAPGPPHEQVFVDTDAFRVRQLVDGLLQNALRATPRGGTVVLAVRPAADGGAEVQVRDSGPGLTEEDVRVAFDVGALHARYRDTRPVGSGLGLAIAHRLAGRLGGTLAVEGHGPEGGAAFTVTLPPAAPGP
jgi:two-component system OmpR family sensor kinase